MYTGETKGYLRKSIALHGDRNQPTQPPNLRRAAMNTTPPKENHTPAASLTSPLFTVPSGREPPCISSGCRASSRASERTGKHVVALPGLSAALIVYNLLELIALASAPGR